MKINYKADLYLLLITVIWGCTFPLIKNTVLNVHPIIFVCIRFFLAALVLLPFVITKLKNTSWVMLCAGLTLGTLNSLIYTTQTIGLRAIGSAQSAFIVGTNVVFVPLLSRLFRIHKIDSINFLCVIIYLSGLLVFTDFTVKPGSGSMWCMVSALFTAIDIILIQVITQKIKLDYKLLTFFQILFTIPLPLLFACTNKTTSSTTLMQPNVIFSLLFCAVLATGVAHMLQTKYQRYVNVTKAALIYSLEPVFACLFGLLFFNEIMSTNMVLGGAIMMAGLFIEQLQQPK